MLGFRYIALLMVFNSSHCVSTQRQCYGKCEYFLRFYSQPTKRQASA